MLTRGVLLAALCAVASPVCRADEQRDRAIQELQGAWRLVAAEKDGKKLPPEHKDDRTLMVIQGQDMTIKPEDPVAAQARRIRAKVGQRHIRFKIDPSKSPKYIDITSLDGQEKGETFACIYKVGKGRFTLCGPFVKTADLARRPAEFTTKDGDGRMVYIFERVK